MNVYDGCSTIANLSIAKSTCDDSENCRFSRRQQLQQFLTVFIYVLQQLESLILFVPIELRQLSTAAICILRQFTLSQT